MSTALEAASLVMVPSGYEDGSLASVKPTDGTGDFTFSRGSNISATRVNEQGNIEKGYENLLPQSNSFSTSWINNQSTETGGQADKDGGTDAWLITKTNSHGRIQQDISASGVQTFSVYAKAGASTWLRLVANTPSFQAGFFDLSNGVTGNIENAIDIEIEDIGSGWYRCSVTFNGNATQFRIYPAETNSSLGTSGSIYIQDAMLNQGLVAYPYVETTTAPVAGGILEDMPRLDYSDSSCPFLKLEPQRTNKLPYSEYFGAWTTQSGITLTPNTDETTSPEGLENAYKIVSTNGTTGFYYTGLNSSADSIRSIYLKGASGGETLFLKDPSGNGGFTSVTLTTEWQRFTHSTSNTGQNYQGLQIDDISVGTIYAYGAQWEEQATYPTSYIPTYGTSQTRLGEASAFELSVFDFFTLGNTESGTFFLETKFTKPSSQNVVDVFSQGGSGTNAWSGTGFQIRDTGGSRNFVVQNIDTLVDDYIKIAIRRDNTTFNVFVNGVKSATTATITNPLKWFDHIALYRNNQNVKQMMEFQLPYPMMSV